MPREPLDTPEDLPKEALRQGAFGQLEDEVPSMPDEAPAGLEQPLLGARQGPALDGSGQDEPVQEMDELLDAREPLGENSDMATTLITSLRRISS